MDCILFFGGGVLQTIMVFGVNEIIGGESIVSKSLGGRNIGYNFFKICLLHKALGHCEKAPSRFSSEY